MTAFLMTWSNISGKPETIKRLVQEYARDGHAYEPWRVHARKQTKIGDRVWLLKQGKRPKGIFGVGLIDGVPFKGLADDGECKWLVRVYFNHIVDPWKEMLIEEATVRSVLPDNKMNAQSSGQTISDQLSRDLDQIYQQNWGRSAFS